MDDKKKNRAGTLVDCLLIAGWAMVSAGAGLLHLAAGLIVAGTLAIAAGVILDRRRDE